MSIIYGPIIAPPVDAVKEDKVTFPNNVVFLQVKLRINNFFSFEPTLKLATVQVLLDYSDQLSLQREHSKMHMRKMLFVMIITNR